MGIQQQAITLNAGDERPIMKMNEEYKKLVYLFHKKGG